MSAITWSTMLLDPTRLSFVMAVISLDIAPVVLFKVKLLELEEAVHSLDGDPGLHEAIDDPGEGIEGTDEDVEQRHTGEHLIKEQPYYIQLSTLNIIA